MSAVRKSWWIIEVESRRAAAASVALIGMSYWQLQAGRAGPKKIKIDAVARDKVAMVRGSVPRHSLLVNRDIADRLTAYNQLGASRRERE